MIYWVHNNDAKEYINVERERERYTYLLIFLFHFPEIFLFFSQLNENYSCPLHSQEVEDEEEAEEELQGNTATWTGEQ